MINMKVEGKEVTAVGPQIQRAQVIDLMDALKESLARRVPRERKPAVKAKPAAEAAPEKPLKKAQAARK
jgi:non-homologous end joining protein Ku